MAAPAELDVERLVVERAERAYARLAIADRREARDRFVYELLFSNLGDDARLLRQADIMGMDLTRPRAVILLKCRTECERAYAERLIQRIVTFFQLQSDAICGYVGAGEVVILKATSTRDLSQWVRSGDNTTWANLRALKRAASELARELRGDQDEVPIVGVGRHHAGLIGLGQSYRDAQAALVLGNLYQPGKPVYALDEIGLGAWVGLVDDGMRVDLASRLVAPLEGNADLLNTLDAFFAANTSPSATASRLAIHRNTLGYRLDRISHLTGLDPRRFDDAVQLRLALLLRRQSCANAQETIRSIPRSLGR
jgi:carbohydrate diacid regulator